MFANVAGDGVLEVGDRLEGAASEAPAVRAEKKPSTTLSQEAEVGVKWKTQQRGWLTFGCLRVA